MKKSKSIYITTHKDFLYFEQKIHYWKNRLGLSEWSINIIHKQLKNLRAETEWDFENKSAIITLSLSSNSKFQVSNRDLEDSAIHELLHVLLLDLSLPLETYVNSDRIAECEHGIINRLCRAFFN